MVPAPLTCNNFIYGGDDPIRIEARGSMIVCIKTLGRVMWIIQLKMKIKLLLCCILALL